MLFNWNVKDIVKAPPPTFPPFSRATESDSVWIGWKSQFLCCTHGGRLNMEVFCTKLLWRSHVDRLSCLNRDSLVVTSPHPPMSALFSGCQSNSSASTLCEFVCRAVRQRQREHVCVCCCLCVFVCLCAHTIKTECMHVFICVCASMRGSLKRSFIQKYTVQGEMSDELFRDISHRRKKVFLEVRPLKGCVCAGVCMCAPVKSKREREGTILRGWERVSGCFAGQRGERGGAHLQSAKPALSMWSHNCWCWTSNNLPKFPLRQSWKFHHLI